MPRVKHTAIFAGYYPHGGGPLQRTLPYVLVYAASNGKRPYYPQKKAYRPSRFLRDFHHYGINR